MAGSCLQTAPPASQPGFGNILSISVGVQQEADLALGLGVEPNPAESQLKSDFQFLDYKDPSDVLPGLGDNGVWSTS